MPVSLACDVAIIGSGPAGLGAAIALRQRGASRVVILERENEIGGVPRHCAHPPYGVREFGRLMTGPAYARRLHALALRHGVQCLTRCSVTALAPHGLLQVASPDGVLTVQARRVLLAAGARETPRAARLLSGDRPLGVLNTGALQAALYLQHLEPGFSRPIIVGTELVALSAIWTCLRHGMRPAAIIDSADRPTARWPLGLFPNLVGLPVHLRSRITEIAGGPGVTYVDITNDTGASHRIPCDAVILTGGFRPETSLMQSGNITLDRGTQGPVIDQYGRCSDPAYFAAGNLLHPIETAGWCFREGQRIGASITEDLRGTLPPQKPRIEVCVSGDIAYATPQAICLGGPSIGLPTIQLRAAAAISGMLTVRQAGKTLFNKPISTRPERRILIPLAKLKLQEGTGKITIAIERKGG